ncbi:MAG: phage portal protein [Clostridia bacterium]|nr:phage portal protein [Clostridia bacterium]
MGLFDKLFHRKPKNSKFAPMLNGYAPLFSQFGTNIYASDVVQQALKCIVDEMKKLNPQHVRVIRNGDVEPQYGSFQAVLDEPNEFMTTTEFIEKCVWLLLLNYNVFIIPVYRVWRDQKTGEEKRYYEALYPILPTQVNFIESAGRLYTEFWFASGYSTTIPYDDVIHVKYNYSVNDYMGGNQFGQPDNEPLLKTLQLNHQLLQGIAKAMNASYAVNGVVKYNTLLDNGKTEAALKELEQKLRNSESGFLPLDLKAEFTPFEHNSEIVNADTLKFIDEKILRNWGIPIDILSGDYSKETYEAFYQKAIEPLIKSFSQAFTKKMFTKREKAFGNQIQFYPEDLIFLSMTQRVELVTQLSPTGGLYENEKRAMFGLRPLPELVGKRYMSLNWIDANNADQYQIGKVNVDVVDEEKQESITEE